jgi:hypothetical protein
MKGCTLKADIKPEQELRQTQSSITLVTDFFTKNVSNSSFCDIFACTVSFPPETNKLGLSTGTKLLTASNHMPHEWAAGETRRIG